MDYWNVNNGWYNGYINACKLASEDDNQFDVFKKNKQYQVILEHVNYQQGLQYLEEIKKTPLVFDNIELFKENDSIGGADLQKYEVGYISPSTLRYVKVLCDLYKLFGNLDNFNICEIGAGYGGQCKIINCLFKPRSYTIIDLAEVNKLSFKYLKRMGIICDIFHDTYPITGNKEYDLVISNYAFSELPIIVQNNYIDKILLNSVRGYITFNNDSTPSNKTLHASTVSNKFSNCQIIDEYPITMHKNKVLYWK